MIKKQSMKHNLHYRIPVIDLFAGPGGLAEGFSAFDDEGGKVFRIGLSVEKDPYAHSTLELRSFFRQFPREQVPEEYYSYLRKEISREELFSVWPEEAGRARQEAWRAELGSEKLSDDEVDARIKSALGSAKKWILIGGPPCQAYSTVGRSRNKGEKSYDYVPEKDNRHFLYREYLKIIARHWPPVFVMENVKGILSAQVNGSRIFDHILADLHDPLAALRDDGYVVRNGYKYKIYSLAKPVSYPAGDFQPRFSPADFLIMSEKYGIPQSRHRVILIGVREDYDVAAPMPLSPKDGHVNAASVLDDLPRLRSGLSREEDTFERWEVRVWEIMDDIKLYEDICREHGKEMQVHIEMALSGLCETSEHDRGKEFLPFDGINRNDWYDDPRLKGVCNHTTKAHMSSDLHRYLFASCFSEIHERSPTLPEFPKKLWPEHKNAHKAKRSGNFSDRFRVQLASKPATTVMSHISKDGHYYIHYDPAQCRSLTVREAARLQTFPDNYFFEGPRTQQYIQVGNAVPPLLAYQIAEVVHDIFLQIS